MSPRRFVWIWAPVVVVTAGIGYVSVRSVGGGPAFPQSDKLLHGLAYALLALVLARGLVEGVGQKLDEAALVACIWATAYGGALEVVQHFVGRTADLFDALANGGGAALAVGVWWAIARWRARRRDDAD